MIKLNWLTKTLLVVLVLGAWLEPVAWGSDRHEYDHRNERLGLTPLQAMHDMIGRHQGSDAWKQLRTVNRFFNMMPYSSDLAVWGKKDFWATPEEFLSAGAGDCEDYAIGKFFALKAMGYPKHKLALAYVKHRELAEAHMVLLVYIGDNVEPFVLDNLTHEIRTLRKRPELLLVYDVNEESIWIHRDNQRIKAGSADQIGAWKRVRESNPVYIM